MYIHTQVRIYDPGSCSSSFDEITSKSSHVLMRDSNVTFFCLSTLIYLGRSGQFVRLKGPKRYSTCHYFNFCTIAKASKMLLRISFARGREDSSTDSRVKDNSTVR